MTQHWLVIVLEGGQSLMLPRDQTSAKILMDEWFAWVKGGSTDDRTSFFSGTEKNVSGRPWNWSVPRFRVVAMNTCWSEGDPTGASLPEVPWARSG